jgi:hypothetical protein
VKSIHLGSRNSSFTKNIEVVAGHLISGKVVKTDGTPLKNELWVAFNPISFTLPEDEWLGAPAAPDGGGFQTVAPSGTYWIGINESQDGSFSDFLVVDLTSKDVVDLVITLKKGNPIPYEPPEATKISIGLADNLGEADVVGQSGSVIPNAIVLLVNLNSYHQSHSISANDGSFNARIYAPPGSAIMVKHGPPGERWRDLDVGLSEGINPFPGTIINVPYSQASVPPLTSFSSVGAVDFLIDDPNSTINSVGSAWAMNGTIGPVSGSSNYSPGESFQIDGKIRLYSQAINASTDTSAISIDGWLDLMMLFDGDGNPYAVPNNFMSTMLTPSGFPIQRNEKPIIRMDLHFSVGNFIFIGGNAIEGDFNVIGNIPSDVQPGIYRPMISFDFSGVPSSTEWLAANVTQFTYGSREALLPPINIGGAGQAKLIWRILMDDFTQGTRGAGAQEDRSKFELSSQIATQGAPFHIPPVDERTGKVIEYRIEPFLPMISFTDRRMPSPPLIPFDLPGGELCVTIKDPNNKINDLGCESFSQSFNRTKTTRAGKDLNSGTVQLEDVYSLSVPSDRFWVTFDQYGHHIVTMTGTVSDLWGNSYTGGGTYDLWVAHTLDMDPGVMPGTPFAVGDAVNPAVHIYPQVPADVNLQVTLYPDSDPAKKVVKTVSGKANRFGYFNSSSSPIIMDKPGEYRVDLTATYLSQSGEMYMGAMTWGGVVMTQPNQADLIAHGRRGMDSLEYIPNHWFVVNRDLDIPEGSIAHLLNPYFNGDIIWSGAVGGFFGDALVMGSSVQDTIGTIETAIQSRVDRVHPDTYSPGSMSERFNAGEIPLFSSTLSGIPVQIAPKNDIDQIAYSYRTSQRPGVRVREIVAEDGQSGGYWRLNTLYDDQLGVGVEGDSPNDFKFQYVGVVYGDLQSGHREYLGQGSGWVFIDIDTDPLGNRVMPPFSGPGNGGWTTEGGPIMSLKGEEIHLFIHPTGVRPGDVLQVGDTFHFAGHILPTLNSKVQVVVNAPGGTQRTINGQGNSIGYFYDPSENFVVNEPGLWSVDVNVWHDGQCSGGSTIPPYPSGNILGSENGRYWFYVVPESSSQLNIFTPSPGFLSFKNGISPITISGNVPNNLSEATVTYTKHPQTGFTELHLILRRCTMISPTLT